MIAVALLVMTGLLNAATILLGGEGHAAPLYLAVLGAKLVLVLAMLALAAGQSFPPDAAAGRAPAPSASLQGNIRLGTGTGPAWSCCWRRCWACCRRLL